MIFWLFSMCLVSSAQLVTNRFRNNYMDEEKIVQEISFVKCSKSLMKESTTQDALKFTIKNLIDSPTW